jgi:hypothetical protein
LVAGAFFICIDLVGQDRLIIAPCPRLFTDFDLQLVEARLDLCG